MLILEHMSYFGHILLGEGCCHKNRRESLDSVHKWGFSKVEISVAEIRVLSVGATIHSDSDNDENLRLVRYERHSNQHNFENLLLW